MTPPPSANALALASAILASHGPLVHDELARLIDERVGPLCEATEKLIAAAPHTGEGAQRATACVYARAAIDGWRPK